MIMGVELA